MEPFWINVDSGKIYDAGRDHAMDFLGNSMYEPDKPTSVAKSLGLEELFKQLKTEHKSVPTRGGEIRNKVVISVMNKGFVRGRIYGNGKYGFSFTDKVRPKKALETIYEFLMKKNSAPMSQITIEYLPSNVSDFKKVTAKDYLNMTFENFEKAMLDDVEMEKLIRANKKEKIEMNELYDNVKLSSIERTIIAKKLEEKSKRQAIKYLYDKFDKLTKKIYNDQYWKPIKEIFDELNKDDIDFKLEKTYYTHDENGNPNSKIWEIGIDFMDDKNQDNTIFARITAHGAGSINDPLDRYDITLNLY